MSRHDRPRHVYAAQQLMRSASAGWGRVACCVLELCLNLFNPPNMQIEVEKITRCQVVATTGRRFFF